MTSEAAPVVADDIVERLKDRACPAGEPWTGDDPSTDHGHTDCWLYWRAINEIERLRTAGDALAAGIRTGRWDNTLDAWEEARRG
jgi:hypothetical protein